MWLFFNNDIKKICYSIVVTFVTLIFFSHKPRDKFNIRPCVHTQVIH